MKEHLLQLFNAFKSSNYYNNSDVEIDLNRLKDKLNENDFEELENQVIAILLGNEEEIFISCLKFAWGLFQELSSSDSAYNTKI